MTDNTVQCCSPGTDVFLWDDIPAKILDVMISQGNTILYRVVWMDGKTRRVEWVDPSEVVVKEADVNSTKIGFCTAGCS